MIGNIFFISMGDPEKQIYYCQSCLDENAVTPFLCAKVTEKVSSAREIKGCLLTTPRQTQIPFYGYKCSECRIKNQKRYFICTDCNEKWCENCFGKKSDCIDSGHSVILETYPFSFWCEKMSKSELSHLKFQNNLVTTEDKLFQQAEMFLETYEYERAIEFYNLYIAKNESKGNDDRLARSFQGLGAAHARQAEYKKALEYHFKALEIKKSIYGENHQKVAGSYSNIGTVYQSKKEYQKALEYFLKSTKMLKSVYGENHPSVASSYNRVGIAYSSLGEYQKALEHDLKSLEIEKAIHGENPHPSVAACYHNIGLIYKKQGQFQKSLEYSLKSTEMLKSVYGENHPDLATCYYSIGLLYNHQGQPRNSVEYFEKALKIQKAVHGENPHPSVANLYHSIALALSRVGGRKIVISL